MNRIRFLAAGAILSVALATAAQQTSSGPGVPTVQSQLALLTGRLDLTAVQQAKIKPILRDLHDATQKLADDRSMSREERLDKVRPLREQTDKKIREILNSDQKKKLDQLEHEPHPELHGDLN